MKLAHARPSAVAGALYLGPMRRTGGLVSGGVLAAGALAYAIAEAAGLLFFATPLFVGIVVLAAGVAGRTRALVPSGCVLTGWGVATLALRPNGPLPSDRGTPADMVGIAVGLLVAALLARPDEARSWMRGGSITAISAGMSYYLAFDWGRLGTWQAWAVALVIWAAFEALLRGRTSGSPDSPPMRGRRAGAGVTS